MKNHIKKNIKFCIILLIISFFTFMLMPRKFNTEIIENKNLNIYYLKHTLRMDSTNTYAYPDSIHKEYLIPKNSKEHHEIQKILNSYKYRLAFKLDQSSIEGCYETLTIYYNRSCIDLYTNCDLIRIDDKLYKLSYNNKKDGNDLLNEIQEVIKNKEISQ